MWFKLGLGVEPSQKRARFWLRKAAKSGYAPARLHLAHSLVWGCLGDDANADKAADIYRELAFQGLGVVDLKAEETKAPPVPVPVPVPTPVHADTTLAAMGSATDVRVVARDAAWHVFMLMESEECGEGEFHASREWLRGSAAAGNVCAQQRLALDMHGCRMHGAAFHWAREAARAGLASALVDLRDDEYLAHPCACCRAGAAAAASRTGSDASCLGPRVDCADAHSRRGRFERAWCDALVSRVATHLERAREPAVDPDLRSNLDGAVKAHSAVCASLVELARLAAEKSFGSSARDVGCEVGLSWFDAVSRWRRPLRFHAWIMLAAASLQPYALIALVNDQPTRGSLSAATVAAAEYLLTICGDHDWNGTQRPVWAHDLRVERERVRVERTRLSSAPDAAAELRPLRARAAPGSNPHDCQLDINGVDLHARTLLGGLDPAKDAGAIVALAASRQCTDGVCRFAHAALEAVRVHAAGPNARAARGEACFELAKLGCSAPRLEQACDEDFGPAYAELATAAFNVTDALPGEGASDRGPAASFALCGARLGSETAQWLAACVMDLGPVAAKDATDPEPALVGRVRGHVARILRLAAEAGFVATSRRGASAAARAVDHSQRCAVIMRLACNSLGSSGSSGSSGSPASAKSASKHRKQPIDWVAPIDALPERWRSAVWRSLSICSGATEHAWEWVATAGKAACPLDRLEIATYQSLLRIEAVNCHDMHWNTATGAPITKLLAKRVSDPIAAPADDASIDISDAGALPIRDAGAQPILADGKHSAAPDARPPPPPTPVPTPTPSAPLAPPTPRAPAKTRPRSDRRQARCKALVDAARPAVSTSHAAESARPPTPPAVSHVIEKLDTIGPSAGPTRRTGRRAAAKRASRDVGAACSGPSTALSGMAFAVSPGAAATAVTPSALPAPPVLPAESDPPVPAPQIASKIERKAPMRLSVAAASFQPTPAPRRVDAQLLTVRLLTVRLRTHT